MLYQFEEMRYIKEKNHVNISEGLEEVNNLGGMQSYGLQFQAFIYLLHLPFLLYHQLVCKNNDWCTFKSRELYEKYELKKDWYKQYLTECMKEQRQLTITQVKIETLK